MTDDAKLIAELRSWAGYLTGYDDLEEHLTQAADRLAALAGECERLRAALERIGKGDICLQLPSMPPQCQRAYAARAALSDDAGIAET